MNSSKPQKWPKSGRQPVAGYPAISERPLFKIFRAAVQAAMTGRLITKACAQRTTPPRALCARTLCPCAIHCALLQNHVRAIVFIEPPHRSTAHDPSTKRRTGGRLSPSRVSTIGIRMSSRARSKIWQTPPLHFCSRPES